MRLAWHAWSLTVTTLCGAVLWDASAGMVTQRFSCGTSSGMQFEIIESGYVGTETTQVYAADLSGRKILFFPQAAARLPEAVAKMDFAAACLTVLDEPNDVCSSVVFLRDRGLISSNDLRDLENHYQYGLDRRDGLSRIKQIYRCYTR